MNLYEMLLANALGESGGGGGSSDFSTATLTINNPDEHGIAVYGAILITPENGSPYITSMYPEHGDAPTNTQIVLSVVVCEGGMHFQMWDDTVQEDVTTDNYTGDIEKITGRSIYSITGNGTITIS